MESAPIASTPPPPYTAVIFTSVRTADRDGYAETGAEMARLAAEQPGFLGVESVGDDVGITISYWARPQDALAWKRVAEHMAAQALGRERWYSRYRVRVATVEREYGHE